MDASEALERIATLTPRAGVLLVGIGGHGCAGKTTLARMIPAAEVVGTDEFWDGERFALERVRSEVLEPLLRGEAASFASFDWAAQAPRDEPRRVRPEGIVVIDGVCALHRMFRREYDLRIWVDTPRDVRLSRAIERDGEEARRTWEEIWLPSEDHYVAQDDPVSAADLIVRGWG
jgi:uridine kinase